MGVITPCYLDTSAAIKLIDRKEAGATNLVRFLEMGSKVIVSSALLKVELHSYLRRIRNDNQVDSETADYFENLSSHLLARLILIPIRSSQLETAIYHLQKSEIQGRLRSLDALHFASFSEYSDRFPATVLLSSDESLLELARECNKESFNPLVEEAEPTE